MISIIVAVAENGVIGRKNDLPWKLSGDLKHFAKVTTGKTVLMGQNTYRSIFGRLGHSLPNRKNIVLTKENVSDIKEEQVHSIEEISKLGEKEDIFIIGGASVYEQMFPFTKKLFLTRVHATPDGDTYFPEVKDSEWKLLSEEKHTKDEKNEYDYTFLEYERKQ